MFKYDDLKEKVDSLKIICVTGPMAAGKNYVSEQLEKEGWKSIDADVLVHKAIEKSKASILQAFEDEAKKRNISILDAAGNINRRELGRLLFSDAGLMAKQEAIVYPVITGMIDEFTSANSKSIINATVLYKTPELLKKCQAVLYVKAPFIKRMLRARKRDGLSYLQIFKRFYSQRALLKNYRRQSDNVIVISN